MKRRHLKRYVITTIYILVLGLMATSITFLSKSILSKKEEMDNYHSYPQSVFQESIPVIEETNTKVSLPYRGENIEVSKEYYSKNDNEEVQENSLIYYANTYMPNTGILYESKDPFEVVSIMPGIVKEIKEDEILGNVITIEHNNRLTSVYYTIKDICVKENDSVEQNQVIAISGNSKLETKEANTLLIETYLDGKIENPNNIFSMNISELE